MTKSDLFFDQTNISVTKRNEKRRGQGLLEYIVLTALVAIACIGTIKTLGGRVKHHITRVSNSFDRTVKQGLRSDTARQSADDNDDMDSDDNGSPLQSPRGRRRPLNWPF
jgi:Flp pilus assembly pilin Flp